MENTAKGRYWTILIFKDNWEKIPDWRERLIDTHLRFCVSPLHDQDKWSELDILKHPDREEYIKQHIGEPKTPHYHVMIHCDDNTTYKTMKDLTESLGLPLPFKVMAPSGMYYYFTHEFNEEKYHYDPNDIRHYNGSDPSDYLFELDKQTKMNMLQELTVEFYNRKCTKFYTMLCIAAEKPNPNYLYLTQTNMYMFKQILVDNINILKEEDKQREREVIKGRFYDGK